MKMQYVLVYMIYSDKTVIARSLSLMHHTSEQYSWMQWLMYSEFSNTLFHLLVERKHIAQGQQTIEAYTCCEIAAPASDNVHSVWNGFTSFLV